MIRQIKRVIQSHGMLLVLIGIVVFAFYFYFVSSWLERSRWFTQNRFETFQVGKQLKSIDAMSLMDQSSIGWDSKGSSYPLIGPNHILVNHNVMPETVYFYSISGEIISRRIVRKVPILLEDTGRVHLGLGLLAEPVDATQVKMLPIWNQLISERFTDRCLIFAERGVIGWQQIDSVRNVTIGDDLWPLVVTELHHKIKDNIALIPGDSGSPVMVKVDDTWYLYALTYGYFTAKSDHFGDDATHNLLIPISPHLEIIQRSMRDEKLSRHSRH
jgi:hypothetical protein